MKEKNTQCKDYNVIFVDIVTESLIQLYVY